MEYNQAESNAGTSFRQLGSAGSQEYAGNVSRFERGLSIGVGALLIYSSVVNFKKTPLRAIFRAAFGTGLIMRGTSGDCPIYRQLGVDGTKTTSVNMRTSFVVNRPRQEVYDAWRNLGTLPRFMKHLQNVTQISDTRSHWEAKFPENNPVSISWDAEIVKDEPGTLLSWRSLPGSTVDNAGKVEFRDALGHQGTEIRVMITYRPPAGNIGSGVGKMLNPLFRKLLKDDVHGFKQYIELQNAHAGDGFR